MAKNSEDQEIQAEAKGIAGAPGNEESEKPLALSSASVASASVTRSATGDLSALMDLALPCYFELGGSTLTIHELLGLTRNSTVMLDRMVGEAGRFMVANKHFANGEVVALPGGYYGVRITQVVAALSGRELAG